MALTPCRWPNGSGSRPTVSSNYGPREAPTQGASTYHRGTDFVGFDQVRAIADGTVVAVGTPSGWSGGGRQVWIQHDGFFSRSLHLGSIAVSEGQGVSRGDYIGAMDTTGTATGKHLHLELQSGNWNRSNSADINPTDFIAARIDIAGGPAGGSQWPANALYGLQWVVVIQDKLKRLGYDIGDSDGMDGPRTQGAVRDFQSKNGLEADGIAGPATNAKMDEKLTQPVGENRTTRPTVDIQKLVGAVADGIWGPETTAKVKVWQANNNLTADGIWGPESDGRGFPEIVKPPMLKVDGVWGEGTTSAVQILLGVLPVDGIRGPATIRAIQTALNMPEGERDGEWGPNTAGYLQRFLISLGYDLGQWGADGDFGQTSVSRLQEFLNSGRAMTTAPPPPPVPDPGPVVPPVPVPVGALTLDISHWQPNFTVDQFKQFAAAGVGTVIVKLGGANGSVYFNYRDPKVPNGSTWREHVAAARAAGLKVGHYWFNGRSGTVEEQIEVIRTAGIAVDETLWWDVEDEDPMGRWTPSEVVKFANALAQAGIPFERQGIYLSSSVTKNQDWSTVVALPLQLWTADYGLNNGKPSSVPLVGYWKTVSLWQYTSTAHLPGYSGNLDMSQLGADVWTVYKLQVVLNKLFNAKLVEDGIPGPKTTKAVEAFQKSAGLTVDGIAGTNTLGALARLLQGNPLPEPEPEPEPEPSTKVLVERDFLENLRANQLSDAAEITKVLE